MLFGIKRIGVCGADFHAFAGRHPAYIYPRVLGHELSGIVLEVPTSEFGIKVGDRCAIDPYMAAILLVGIVSARRTKITGQVFFWRDGRYPGEWSVRPFLPQIFPPSTSWGLRPRVTTKVWSGGTSSGWLFSLILLSLVFAPFYFRSRVSTLPEFLERRYSSASRSILAVMAIMAALFIHIGMSLYAGAVVFQQFFGIRVEVSILIVSVIVSIYTIFGGLEAVVVTETLNTAILLVGVCIITIFAIPALPAQRYATSRVSSLNLR